VGREEKLCERWLKHVIERNGFMCSDQGRGWPLDQPLQSMLQPRGNDRRAEKSPPAPAIPPIKLRSCFGADRPPLVPMPDNATTCTLNTFGTFSTPTFAAVGEPYDSKKGTGASRRHSRPSGAAQHTHQTSLTRPCLASDRRRRPQGAGPAVHDQQAAGRADGRQLEPQQWQEDRL